MLPHIYRYEISPNTWMCLECTGVLHASQSNFQKIEIVESLDFGKMLILDNVINLTERDEFVYHEMLTHVAMFSHPNPQKVLIVGGGDGGTAREALKHPGVKGIQLVEIDEEVISVSRRYFPSIAVSFNHPKVEVQIRDAVEYMKETRERFDIILIDSTDPVIDQSGGLFSVPFYRDCLKALTEQGILAAQVGDIGFETNIVLGVFNGLKQCFPITRMYLAPVPSYTIVPYAFAFCSKSMRPELGLGLSRFDEGFQTRYYNPQTHGAALSLPEHLRKEFEN
jgi:spermidine synthase